MKKWLNTVLLLFLFMSIRAQQYPFWSQTRSNYFMANPAVAGYRHTLDVRANYRYQWTGFDGGPQITSLSAHSRFFKGKMGAGMYVYQDKLGPQKITSIAGAYAYHIKFEDAEFSLGMNVNYNTNGLDASKITYQSSHDQLLITASSNPKAKNFNTAFGILLHNEKFYIGLSGTMVSSTTFKFREKKGDSLIAHIKTTPHYSFAVGYNWTETEAYIWENSLIASFVPNTPILIDYNCKLHLKQTIYFGAGIRVKTCIYGMVGYTIKGIGQIGYAYDFNTNALMHTNYGSHEIKLVYIFDNESQNKHRGGSGFQRQKYQYMKHLP